jgi:hypothetical protein
MVEGAHFGWFHALFLRAQDLRDAADRAAVAGVSADAVKLVREAAELVERAQRICGNLDAAERGETRS